MSAMADCFRKRRAYICMDLRSIQRSLWSYFIGKEPSSWSPNFPCVQSLLCEVEKIEERKSLGELLKQVIGPLQEGGIHIVGETKDSCQIYSVIFLEHFFLHRPLFKMQAIFQKVCWGNLTELWIYEGTWMSSHVSSFSSNSAQAISRRELHKLLFSVRVLIPLRFTGFVVCLCQS